MMTISGALRLVRICSATGFCYERDLTVLLILEIAANERNPHLKRILTKEKDSYILLSGFRFQNLGGDRHFWFNN
ncbi:hypothetical protein NECAME_10760 [Necator americanus]|uniref:Uncharacterized protein n=1 Tax=Necator americanus TaxID=51031 RepID=W2T9H4_NECAM|nr:hypothetical protein NECAME_10760 [Necator americanus]ETN77836.1 hypothetical protein NECAME_10760 [Necator americanus]